MTILPFRWLILPFVLAGGILFVLDIIWARREASAAGRNFVGILWSQEHWLGGPVGADLRQKLGQWCFDAVVVVWMIRLLVAYSTIQNTATFQAALFDLTMLLMMAKIVLFSRYSYRQMLTAAILLAPFFAAQIAIPYHMMMICYFMVLAAKDIDPRRTLKFYMAVTGFLTALFAVLSCAGVIAFGLERSNEVEGGYQMALGFFNPNIASAFVFSLCCGWLLLRFYKMRWFDFAGIGALFLVVFLVLKGRGIEVAMVVLAAVYLFYRLLPRAFASAPMRWLYMLSPLVGCVAWFTVAALYTPENPTWWMLNNLSSDRIKFCSIAFNTFPKEWIVSHSYYTPEVTITENLFFEALYHFGALSLIVTLVLAVWMAYGLHKRKAWPELIVFIGMLTVDMFELQAMYPYFNMLLWSGAALLYGQPITRMRLIARPPEQTE